MNYSQSVFKFLWRLDYHKSCSYPVHKSCSYGLLFSLQEFKQTDLRTSCTSSNYCVNFREKQIKEKKKKKKSLYEEKKRRKKLEFYETLVAELRLEKEYSHNILSDE